MRVFELKRTLMVPQPLDEVFTFFSNPYNLEAITPPWMHFGIRAISDPTIRAGTEIQYALKVRGLPLRWTSRITGWDPPHGFVDEQLRGPYRLWIHSHTFEARGDGTIVGDHVRYAPLGGWLADRLFVRADLERIFDYRHQRLTELMRPTGSRSRWSATWCTSMSRRAIDSVRQFPRATAVPKLLTAGTSSCSGAHPERPRGPPQLCGDSTQSRAR